MPQVAVRPRVSFEELIDLCTQPNERCEFVTFRSLAQDSYQFEQNEAQSNINLLALQKLQPLYRSFWDKVKPILASLPQIDLMWRAKPQEKIDHISCRTKPMGTDEQNGELTPLQEALLDRRVAAAVKEFNLERESEQEEKARLKRVILAQINQGDRFQDFQPYLVNWNALLNLLVEQRAIWSWYETFSHSHEDSSALLQLLGLKTAEFYLSFQAKRLQKIQQIVSALDPLLLEFQEQNVIAIPEIKTPHGKLDLLLRLPERKINFAIALRSQRGTSIIYREDKEALYRRQKTGLNVWKPDHLQKLGDQEFWIRRNKKELLGSSVKQRAQPIIKLLVLYSDTVVGPHSKELYKQVGSRKIVQIKKKSTTHLLEVQDLVEVIKHWNTED